MMRPGLVLSAVLAAWLSVAPAPTHAEETDADTLTGGQFVLCQGVAVSGLACRVWIDFNESLLAYQDELAAGGNLTPDAFAPFFLMPRFQSAVGQPDAAFQSIADWLGETEGDAYALWGNPTEGLYRSSSWLSTDPLHADETAVLPDVLAINDLEVRADALIVTARMLAANGDEERARAMFALAWDIVHNDMEGDLWERTRQLGSLFAMWAAAGFGDDAEEAAARLSETDAAFARLAMVEGAAATGDHTMTMALAERLPGWLPLLGQISLAEAYRRQGDEAQARATLDAAADAMENGDGAARNPAAHLRLAQGYAMLGDMAAARAALESYDAGPHLEGGLARPDIAPLVACHDMGQALRLISEDANGRPDPMDVVNILVAASASGAGDEAYAVAAAQQHAFTRSLYLLAISIGLKHRELSAFRGTPCSTVSINAF
ncbi:MAG: hypothetical protein AAF563_20880 [Pseudomonadota bacterium]